MYISLPPLNKKRKEKKEMSYNNLEYKPFLYNKNYRNIEFIYLLL